MNLQDVQDDEQAHEFVIYTDGSATMRCGRVKRCAQVGGWLYFIAQQQDR